MSDGIFKPVNILIRVTCFIVVLAFAYVVVGFLDLRSDWLVIIVGIASGYLSETLADAIIESRKVEEEI